MDTTSFINKLAYILFPKCLLNIRCAYSQQFHSWHYECTLRAKLSQETTPELLSEKNLRVDNSSEGRQFPQKIQIKMFATSVMSSFYNSFCKSFCWRLNRSFSSYIKTVLRVSDAHLCNEHWERVCCQELTSKPFFYHPIDHSFISFPSFPEMTYSW